MRRASRRSLAHVEFVLEEEFQELTVAQAVGGGFLQAQVRVCARPERRSWRRVVWRLGMLMVIIEGWGCFGERFEADRHQIVDRRPGRGSADGFRESRTVPGPRAGPAVPADRAGARRHESVANWQACSSCGAGCFSARRQEPCNDAQALRAALLVHGFGPGARQRAQQPAAVQDHRRPVR